MGGVGVVVGVGGCRLWRVGLGGSFPAVNDDDSTAVCRAEGQSHVIRSNVCPSVCL